MENCVTVMSKRKFIVISMNHGGNPDDNAWCEWFMKTLKYEEVDRNEYRDLAGTRVAGHFQARHKIPMRSLSTI